MEEGDKSNWAAEAIAHVESKEAGLRPGFASKDMMGAKLSHVVGVPGCGLRVTVPRIKVAQFQLEVGIMTRALALMHQCHDYQKHVRHY